MSCPLEWYPGTVADFLEQALKSSALDPCQKEGALDKDKMTQKAEEFANTIMDELKKTGVAPPPEAPDQAPIS